MRERTKKNPKVSVVIPNYNHANYLDGRIRSVLNQTYQDFELIILDDCSPDNGASRRIIEKYRKNPHVSHIVYNEVNSGSTFKQWHKGMELAVGELIWIAESDDTCELNFLERLVGQFEKYRQCVLAYCISVLFNDNGEVLGKSGKHGEDSQVSGTEFIRDYMCLGNAIWNASSALFKRKVALGVDKQYESYKGAGDRLFWIEIAEKGDVAIVNKPLNYFRQHPNNSTNRYYANGTNQKEDKQILEYIYINNYISYFAYCYFKEEYAKKRVLSWGFDNNQIKQNTIVSWRLSLIERFCAVIYRQAIRITGLLR